MSRTWIVLGLAAIASIAVAGVLISGAPRQAAHGPAAEGRPDLGEIPRLYQQIRALAQSGRIEEAASLLRQTLAIHEEFLGPEHPRTAQDMHNLGALLYSLARSDEAERYLNRALEVRRKVLGADHPDVATSLETLGIFRLERGNFEGAEDYLGQALAIREKSLGGDHLLTSTSLANRGALYRRMAEYRMEDEYFDRAQEAFERALAIRRKGLGDEHPDTAKVLDDLGELLLAKGDARAAQPYLERALSIREKVLRPDDMATGLSLNNLGVCLMELGDLRRSRDYLERAVKVYEEVLGPRHPETALRLNHLGRLLQMQGEQVRAQKVLARALSIHEQAGGEDNPWTARSLNDLALVHTALGDYPTAIEQLERALEINRTSVGPDHPAVAMNLSNLAHLFEELGDLHSAQGYYERALAISERTRGPGHPDTGSYRNNLAHLLFLLGEYASAKDHYKRALTTFEEALGEDHPNVAQALHNLGGILLTLGDLHGAKRYLERALSIRESVLGSGHIATSQSLHALGQLYFELGDLKAAGRSLERALKIRRETLGTQHPQTIKVLHSLSVIREGIGDLSQALKIKEEALRAEERYLSSVLPFATPRRKLIFRRTFAGSTYSTVSLHTRSMPASRAALEVALTTVLRRKGRALEATAVHWGTLRQRLDPDSQEVFDRLLQEKAQRAYLLMRDPQGLGSHLSELEERIDRAELGLSRDLAPWVAPSPVTIRAVQEAIPRHTALVEYYKYRSFDARSRTGSRWQEPRYVAYVVHRSGPPAWVSLGEAKVIEAAVDDFLEAVSERSLDVKERAARLDELVLRPVRPRLADASELAIAPDGALNRVSFAALVDESGRYLIERYGLRYLTSGRDLVSSRAAPSREPPLIVGDPDFDAALEPMGGETRRSADLANLSFKSLPGSAREAEDIGEALAASSPRVLTGSAASELSVKQVHGPRILHLATHGFFLDDQPWNPIDPLRDDRVSAGRVEDSLVRSGLALSGANRWRKADGPNDGLLTAAEVAGLDLWGTELVVLSACGTGLGQVRTGEGVFGLRRALVLAGSRTQVMTLWDLDDHVAAETMLSFYQQLKEGVARAEALRRAQLALLRGERLPATNSLARQGRSARPGGEVTDPSLAGTRHPYYWAGAILSGETGPLDHL